MDLPTKQTRILQYLAGSDAPATRKEMETSCGRKGFSAALGSPTTGIRPDSLEARGFVRRLDGQRPFLYEITDAGRNVVSSATIGSSPKGEVTTSKAGGTAVEPYEGYEYQLSYIQNSDVEAAFIYLANASQDIDGYEARPNVHGFMERNIHYYNEKGRSDFAFSVYQAWLRFYFRHPKATHPSLMVSSLSTLFDDVKLTAQGELTFKVYNLDDAKSVMDIAFGDGSAPDPYSFPDELSENIEYQEGAVTVVKTNSYERNARARAACIAHFGYACSVCGLNFEDKYGDLGERFIHVHHLIEVSSIGAEYTVDPIRDLRPVCPNCHAMLHKNSPPLTIEELQEIVEEGES